MEKLIPIGSIVNLKEGEQKIMILNRCPQVDTGEGVKVFDYSGSVYPIGLISNQIFYFNAENIEKVIFEGYSDEDEEKFKKSYQEWRVSDEGVSVVRGKVEEPLKEE